MPSPSPPARSSCTSRCPRARWAVPACSPTWPSRPGRSCWPAPTARAARGTRRPQLQVDGHVLGLEVLLDALGTALAAEARLLDAAEGGGGVGDHALIESDHAGLEPLGYAQSSLEVAGEDVGDEAVLGVIRGGDRLVLVVEALHRGDRAEDLLAEKVGVLGHVGQHG